MLRVRLSRRGRPGLRQTRRARSSPPAGRRARSAATRSTPRVTSARARTDTGADVALSCRRGTRDPSSTRPTRWRSCSGGELEVHGRLVEASNATLSRGRARRRPAACVYKPIAGERPLWDFPDGTLAEREVAAYLLSEATGWEHRAADRLRATGRSGRAASALDQRAGPRPGAPVEAASRAGGARRRVLPNRLAARLLDAVDGRRAGDASSSCTPTTRPAPDGGPRRRRQQRRPQGRPRAAER